MKKTIFGLIFCAVFLPGCGRMNVDFPPPSDSASVTELFPASVDGAPMRLTDSGLSQGLAYAYQGVGSVWVYRTNDEASAAAFFRARLRCASLLCGMSNSVSRNRNGIYKQFLNDFINPNLRLVGKITQFCLSTSE